MVRERLSWAELRETIGMRADDWYILRCMPGRESIAAQFIDNRMPGATTYFPVAKGERIVRGVQTEVKRAAFVGYVYARFEQAPRFLVLEQCTRAMPKLMYRIDSDGEEVAPLYERDCVVQDVMRRELLQEFDQQMANPFHGAVVGGFARISRGPFIGKVGEITAIVGEHCKLKLKFIGGKRAFVSFKLDEIEF